jgi:hypothetical protein
MAYPHRQHEELVRLVVTEVVLINIILFGLLVWTTSAALPSWVDWALFSAIPLSFLSIFLFLVL